jgi:hypothetical protein
MGEYPLKHIRLKQLYDSGFNIADFVCFAPNQLDPVKLRKFFDKHVGKEGISLRHFYQDETRYFKCPVKYEVKDWDEALRFCTEHNKTFYSLVNEAIRIDKSEYAGNIWLLDERDFVVEYFSGPGTPRDTETKELKFIKRHFGEPFPEGAPPALLKLGPLFRGFLPETRPIVIEFNIYPYGVGKRNEEAIIWEWRQGLIHESVEVVEYLSNLVDRLKAERDILERMLTSR